jgi:hypothetical protein
LIVLTPARDVKASASELHITENIQPRVIARTARSTIGFFNLRGCAVRVYLCTPGRGDGVGVERDGVQSSNVVQITGTEQRHAALHGGSEAVAVLNPLVKSA